MLDELKSMLQEHHKLAGFICCDEACFCWDIKNFIISREKEEYDNFQTCPKCGGKLVTIKGCLMSVCDCKE